MSISKVLVPFLFILSVLIGVLIYNLFGTSKGEALKKDEPKQEEKEPASIQDRRDALKKMF